MNRSVRWVLAAAAGVVVLGGCGPEGGELREATERRRAEEAARGDTLADTATTARAAEPLERLPAFVLTDTPTVQPAPTEPRAPAAEADAAAAPGDTEWTAGRREVIRGRGVATLREVRLGVNAGFDRMVVEFAGGEVPGYLVEYVDRPVRQCGSGDPVQIAGDGWLRIRMRPARAHDDQGRATIADRHRTPRMPVVREMRFTCDFEADAEIVLGVGSPNRFRVFEQANPARLVVDVQH